MHEPLRRPDDVDREARAPRFDEFDLTSLRTGVMAGSPCPVEVMKRAVERHARARGVHRVRDDRDLAGHVHDPPDDDLERRVSTVGKVFPNVDAKWSTRPPARRCRGAPGEICTRGYVVMRGYWEDAEATAEAVDADGWMHTGDLGVMDADGYLNIVGRSKDMVIRGGENIYPREIEEVLFDHPGVASAQVVGVPDERMGEELMAWVVSARAKTFDEDDLRAFCRERLAHFKVPRYWKIVDEFPMTVTGKVQKFKMREIAIAELGLGKSRVDPHRLRRLPRSSAAADGAHGICHVADVRPAASRDDAAMAQSIVNLQGSDVPDAVASELPTGTVTFLLTDVEGSTKLWEAGADETAVCIARHYELLDAAITLHGGVRPVEQGEGDSVVAAFETASNAVAAALDIQRAFADEPWPADNEVRVRMALHTGEIRLRDAGNYFGPTIIRCARMRAIGHGGQTLISNTTRDLVVEALPQGAELRDLGLHRLKDLGRAERTWQLVHSDIPHEFPPLRSLGALPTNLPAEVSSFVGRDAEMAALRDVMREHRLVTLTGTGGCGKTRLAMHVAAEELDTHADGVWFVELAAVAHRGDIAETVANVFGLREEFGAAADRHTDRTIARARRVARRRQLRASA